MEPLKDGRYLTRSISGRQRTHMLWVEVTGGTVRHGATSMPADAFLLAYEVVPRPLSDEAWERMDAQIRRAIVAAGKAAKACGSLQAKLAKQSECKAMEEQQRWHRLGRFSITAARGALPGTGLCMAVEQGLEAGPGSRSSMHAVKGKC